jgi:hypothetical protein
MSHWYLAYKSKSYVAYSCLSEYHAKSAGLYQKGHSPHLPFHPKVKDRELTALIHFFESYNFTSNYKFDQAGNKAQSRIPARRQWPTPVILASYSGGRDQEN